jgi:hypothetical protein
MSFNADNLDCKTQSSSGPLRDWRYTTNDAHTDVDATGYFAGMAAPARNSKGMKLLDSVEVIDVDTGTTTRHHVSAIDASGNVTISVATLS